MMLAGKDAKNSALCPALERPAGWGSDSGTHGILAPWPSRGQGVGELACGAKNAPKSAPDEAVESLEMIVLLMRFTPSESCNDTPPPSHPATLLAMMLLVTLTEYQRDGIVLGKKPTSAPLTPWKRMPPPLPLPQRYP